MFDDQLLCHSTDNEKSPGVIKCYDLNENPPKIAQVIPPPKEMPHGDSGGFGYTLSLHGNTLMVSDKDATYSEAEIKTYGLTSDDLKITAWNNGKPQPVQKSTILLYGNIEGKWEFVADLFPLRPHPPGGVLRYSSGGVFGLSQLPTLTTDKVYMRGEDGFYVAENTNGTWYYKKNIKSPFPLKNEIIVFGDTYTIRKYVNGGLEIYRTVEIEKWKPVWKYGFLDKNKFEIEPGKEMDVESISISGDTIVVSHSCPEAYDSRHS